MSFPLPAWASALPSPPPPEPWAAQGLGPRLADLAALVPAGVATADIGTDHGLLPAALLRTRHVPRALGCDRARAPLQAAERRWGGTVELRLGEGLDPLAPGEVGCVVLAGFGGRKMVEVLQAERLADLGIERVVVQPTAGLPGLRSHLAAHGWIERAARASKEGDRGFITAGFARGPIRALEPLEALIGALAPSDPLLRAFMETQRDHLGRMGPRGAELRARVLDWLAAAPS